VAQEDAAEEDVAGKRIVSVSDEKVGLVSSLSAHRQRGLIQKSVERQGSGLFMPRCVWQAITLSARSCQLNVTDAKQEQQVTERR
jgi:hypothetical protein